MGRLLEAHELLNQARELAERIGSRRDLWRILLALSDIESQRGDIVQAEPLRAQAREIVQVIAKNIPPELCASFLNLPETQALIA